jgi:hypothetical protein
MTPVPDIILDQWAHELSGAEFKVLLYLCRRTFGFRRDSAGVSATQIAEGLRTQDGRVLDRGTGLHISSVREAIGRLVDLGLVLVQHQYEASGACKANRYTVNIAPLTARQTGATSPAARGPQPPAGPPPPAAATAGPPVSRVASPLSEKAVGTLSEKAIGPLSEKAVGPLSGKATGSINEGRTNSEGQTAATNSFPAHTTGGSGAGDTRARPEPAVVVAELIQHGLDEAASRRLVRQYGSDRCRRQMRLLRYRPQPPAGTRTGQLLRSIEQDWGEPEGYREALQREQRRAGQAARAEAERAAQNQRAARSTALRDAWERLDAAHRARLEAEAERRLAQEFPDRQLWSHLPRAAQEALRQEKREELLDEQDDA